MAHLGFHCRATPLVTVETLVVVSVSMDLRMIAVPTQGEGGAGGGGGGGRQHPVAVPLTSRGENIHTAVSPARKRQCHQPSPHVTAAGKADSLQRHYMEQKIKVEKQIASQLFTRLTQRNPKPQASHPKPSLLCRQPKKNKCGFGRFSTATRNSIKRQ